MKLDKLKKRISEGRKIEQFNSGMQSSTLGDTGDELFSIIDLLKGTWTSSEQGWNLIALPFRDPDAPFNYRVLMNQYGENLSFNIADKTVPNRGITPDENDSNDQFIDAIDYEQIIHQVAADDFPKSNLREIDGRPIHHEPGFFMQILNHTSQDDGEELKVARLATIPHGDSVLAMGKVQIIEGAPTIPDVNALPIRVGQDVEANPYLSPYKHFEDNKFIGTVPESFIPPFPGFFATNANAILQFANNQFKDRVKKTTILHFDTNFGTEIGTPGGIVNIPFVVKEANAAEMVATFWIMELEPEDKSCSTEFIMQYSQTVLLDFFPSRDNPNELIRWPHVSINTLRKS